MSHKKISFIIPHKGREEFLALTLQSITQQKFDLSQVEVILVTQNKTLEDITLKFKDDLDLKIYYQPITNSISALRNYGVKESGGDYLAFLDADVALDSNWIEVMINTLYEKNERVLISAAQKSSTNPPPLERIRTALSNAVVDQNVNFLPGRNLFLSREIFDKSGRFPEHLITCEDYYFTDMVHKLGDLFYTSKTKYIHLGEDKDFTEMYHKEIWRGQSNLKSIKGRDIPYSEYPSFIIPILITSLFILSCLFFLTGNILIGSISFVLSLIPFMAYTTRLYFLAKTEIDFKFIFKFYLYYFPARAIGTLVGLLKSIKTNDHQ